MATFWKGFAIFWIIFLIWYLSGGPQRVTLNGASPVSNFDSTSTATVPDSANSAPSFSNMGQATESAPSTQVKPQTEKSFAPEPKTNTINVSN